MCQDGQHEQGEGKRLPGNGRRWAWQIPKREPRDAAKTDEEAGDDLVQRVHLQNNATDGDRRHEQDAAEQHGKARPAILSDSNHEGKTAVERYAETRV